MLKKYLHVVNIQTQANQKNESQNMKLKRTRNLQANGVTFKDRHEDIL